jgi:hypothetical protein
MNLKRSLRRYILNFVNAPSGGIKSSQTLYECAFYLINSEDVSRRESLESITDALLDIQLPDGGFDIGYNFQFGVGLKKSQAVEATSPEMLALVALCKLSEELPERVDLKVGIFAATRWILERAVSVKSGFAVPYAPYSCSDIHITNATSFCLSGLVHALPYLQSDLRIRAETVSHGMISFMHGQLLPGEFGAYWPYFHMGAPAETSVSKIDNYHIAQQLYHHCLISNRISNELNLDIIRLTSKYLVSQISGTGFVPYIVAHGKASTDVHVWGYSSVIPALLAAYDVCADESLLAAAKRCAQYLETNFALSDHFAPIYSEQVGDAVDTRFYPRSDAWVLHAVSELSIRGLASAALQDTAQRCMQRIVAAEFSGLENHALTFRKRLFGNVVRLLRYK